MATGNELATEHALLEYKKFRASEQLTIEHESDFDRMIKQISIKSPKEAKGKGNV